MLYCQLIFYDLTYSVTDTCIRVNTDIDGITLKSIKAVPRTSLCHDLCVTTDKCTAYVIRNRACTLKAAPNSYSEVPVDDVIAGKLSCELEEMDAGLLLVNKLTTVALFLIFIDGSLILFLIYFLINISRGVNATRGLFSSLFSFRFKVGVYFGF